MLYHTFRALVHLNVELERAGVQIKSRHCTAARERHHQVTRILDHFARRMSVFCFPPCREIINIEHDLLR
jgi:hypothetical protein